MGLLYLLLGFIILSPNQRAEDFLSHLRKSRIPMHSEMAHNEPRNPDSTSIDFLYRLLQ